MGRVFAAMAALHIAPILSEQCLAHEQSWSIDIGGQLRERFESANNPVFGLSTPTQNDYLLQRAMLSADGRSASGLRLFVELASNLTFGWQSPAPPIQKDPIDVLQAFVETPLSVRGERIALRFGREELTLGSSRLVSVREGPNVRLAFDGVRLTWADEKYRSVTTFFVRPVIPEDGVFDDQSSRAESLWGIYVTWPAIGSTALGLDAYYLGLDKHDAVFAQGVARELRHTIGARAFGQHSGWDWDMEAAWQSGSFGDSSIDAWTISMHAGFEIAALPLAPRIGLKVDAISGDRNLNDRQLNTFNPLFPKLPYFSEANLTTPANLFDVQPHVRLAITKCLSATVGWNRLWKYETSDAFYAPPLFPVEGTLFTRSRDIGWQASALMEWRPTEQFELGATYVTYEPHTVILQAGGRSGSFLAIWLRWTI